MAPFTDKVVLVTGSSRGIGAAMARRFAAHGARVVVHGRDAAQVEHVRAEIGESAMGVCADATQLAELEAARQQIEDRFGPPDVVVANAGGSLTRAGLSVEEIDLEDWRRSIDANLTATFLTMKCFLPAMKQRRSGCILTVSSAAARRPTQFSPTPYAAAKAAVELLTQQVATQVGAWNVRVCCIAPEIIMTEANERQIPIERRPALIDSHPLKRLGTPDDVASAALYLASDEASWLTGVILDVAGGSVLTR